MHVMMGAYLHLQPEQALHKALRSRSILGAWDAVWHCLALLALGVQADLHRQLGVRRLLCSAAQQRPVNGIEQLPEHLHTICTFPVVIKLPRNTKLCSLQLLIHVH